MIGLEGRNEEWRVTWTQLICRSALSGYQSFTSPAILLRQSLDELSADAGTRSPPISDSAILVWSLRRVVTGEARRRPSSAANSALARQVGWVDSKTRFLRSLIARCLIPGQRLPRQPRVDCKRPR